MCQEILKILPVDGVNVEEANAKVQLFCNVQVLCELNLQINKNSLMKIKKNTSETQFLYKNMVDGLVPLPHISFGLLLPQVLECIIKTVAPFKPFIPFAIFPSLIQI